MRILLFFAAIFSAYSAQCQDQPKCNPGDVSPAVMSGGGLRFNINCEFKSVDTFNVLYDPLQPVDWIGGSYMSSFEIVDSRTGIVERSGQNESRHAQNISIDGRDTVGKIVVIGSEYERYMPELKGVKNRHYDTGWSGHMEIPTCGCLRRIKIESDIVPTKKIEYLYSGKAKSK